MNKKARRILDQIEYEIFETSVRFELLLSLFGTKENLQAINKTAPGVFTLFHKSLLESIVLGLNRLCDPPQDFRKNNNISLKALTQALPRKLPKNQSLHSRLDSLLITISKEVGKMNKFRSKRLAHNDRRTHFSKSHRKIPNSAINEALIQMEQFVNEIRLHFENSSVHLLNPPHPLGDGPDKLIKILNKGINCQQ